MLWLSAIVVFLSSIGLASTDESGASYTTSTDVTPEDEQDVFETDGGTWT